MRASVLATALSLCLVGICNAQKAHASIRKDTQIPAEGVAAALQTLAKEYNFQVLYRTEVVKDLQTQGASGSLTPEEALSSVLAGTGLSYKYLDANTVTVYSLAAPAFAAAAGQDQSSNQDKEGGKKTSQDFRVAQAAQGQNSGASQVTGEADTTSQQKAVLIQEVIVTAQKREERLQDVPVPVSAISAQTLVEMNQVRLQDYYSSIPAFTVSPSGYPGNIQQLTIRGLSSGATTTPTVAVIVDDVPFGSSGGSSGEFGGNVVPDFDPSDLARVEVLRGPQGTLYGASSMGGLVKFVTADPSTNDFSGHVQADGNSVYNGAEVGYGVRGLVNVPLTDTLAVRASAFTRRDPGYIDNPTLNSDGVNSDRASGGRLSALWHLSETSSLKLSALYQDTKADGLGEVDIVPGLGDLQQNSVRGCCAWEKKLQGYSALLNAKLGNFDFTSVTGYNVNSFSTGLDYTYVYGAAAQAFLGNNYTTAPAFSNGDTRKFTQEIRASIAIGSKFDWLVGGFFSHDNIAYSLLIPGEDPVSGVLGPTLFLGTASYTDVEYAAFTDLTVHFSDQFDIQFGGRESYLKEIARPVPFSGALFAAFGGEIVYPRLEDTADAFTYLVTPRFKLSPDLMLYARIASGFRAGTPNNFNTDPLIPRAATPDKTQNYELGVKGDFLDHAVSLDASLYYIDWKNIQLVLLDTRDALQYNANGSRAKSEGLELSAEVRPLSGLSVSGWVAFDDAVLTEDMPPSSAVYGPSGTRLPYGARFSGNFAINQSFPLAGQFRGLLGAQLAYIGDRLGSFAPSAGAARADYPAYAKVDLRAGVTRGPWSINVYANNVADRRGLVGGGPGSSPPYGYYYIQPRTVGLNANYSF